MATITSLDFNVRSSWDGSGIKEARADLDLLKADLDKIANTRAEATVGVKIDKTGLDEFRSELDEISNMHVTATVSVNVDDSGITRLRTELDEVGAMHVVASASVNTDTAKLDAMRAELTSVGNMHVTATATVNTDTAKLNAMRDELAAVGRTHATATASVNVNSANLDALDQKLAALGRTHAIATASVNTNSGNLDALQARLERFAATRATATANVNTDSGNLSALEARLTAFGASHHTSTADVNTDSAHTHLTRMASDASTTSHFVGALASMAGGAGTAIGGLASAAGGGGSALSGLGSAAGGASSGLSSVYTAIGAIVLVIGLLDAVAPIAAASIALIPVAFIGVAALLISTNKGLKQSFTDTFSQIEKTLVPLAMPVINALLKALQQVNSWLHLIGPAINEAFAAAAPLVQPLLNIVEKLVGGALPGFTQAMRNMGPLFDGLGTGALKLGGYLGQMADIFSKIPGLGTAMNGIMGALGQVLVQVATAISAVVSVDHGQLLIQLLQALAVWIKASIPLLQLIDVVFIGLAVIMRGLGDVVIALEVAWRALVGLFSGTGPIVAALKVAWDASWNAIKISALAIWDGLKIAWKGTVDGLKIAWDAVSGALVVAWNTVWNGMKTVAEAIWDGLKIAWKSTIDGLKTAWDTVSSALATAWNAVWTGMKTVAEGIWTGLQTAWSTFINTMKSIWDTVSAGLKAAWETVWTAIKGFAESTWNALKTAWSTFVNALTAAWNTLGAGLKKAWETVWTAIKGFAESTWNALKTAWSTFSSALTSIWNTISAGLKKAWDNTWSALKKALSDFVGAAKDIWNGLKKAFEDPIHFVIATVINGGILKAINWVVDKLGGHSNLQVPVPFAKGGHVTGPGTGTSDSIPARLSDGEFVMRAEAVDRIGVDKLHAMNNGSEKAGVAATVKSNMTGGFADGGLSIGDIESMFGDIIKGVGGAGAGILAKAIGSAGSLAKAVGGGVQGAANAVGNAAGHIPGVGGAAKSIIKGIGHLFGGGAKKAGNAGTAIADALAKWGKKEFDSAAGDLINKVMEKLPIPDGNGPIGMIGSGATKTMFKAAADHLKGFISDYLFQQNQTNVTAHAVAGPKAVQAWAPVVLQALQMEGHPASWLAPILTTMAKESGGNPNAINRTDSNAKAGIPSQGLMQVIPPTFAQYHEPGTSNNILDPLANIAAAINYIVARYGVPTGKSPYASGTTNATPGMHLVGENGPEMVMFGGGETVKNASDTASMLSLPTDQMDANKTVWASYTRALASDSSTAWGNIRQSQSTNMNAMQTEIVPFTSGLKNAFGTVGSDVANTWKQNWSNNGSMFRNTLNTAQVDSTNFNSTLKKDFAENGAAVSSQWKLNWDTNQAVLAGNLTSTQVDATNFQNELKSNFETSGTLIGTQWKTMWDKATTDSNNDFTTMGTDAQNMWNGTKATFTAGQAYLTGTFFPPVNDLMVNKLPQSFTTSVSNIGSGWLHLEAATHDPVAAVVDVVYNKGIVGVWNLIAKAFGAPQLATFAMPGFATGGAVNGPGTGTSDSVVARLSAGEHVWTAAEVSAAGGHQAVANMRSGVMQSTARAYGNGNGAYAAGGAVVPPTNTPVGATGGNPTTPTGTVGGAAGSATPTTPGGTLGQLAAATLGSIHQIANPLITAAVAAGKTAVDAVTVAGSGMRTAGENMGANMGKAATDYITANDIAPTFIFGGGNDIAAQAWADSRVGEPYVLGGDFVNGIDCSEYQSGIARAILGQTPSPWFTTFAFNGATAPAGFVENLQAPYMVGVTNVGVGHMAGTLNGKNYEATPPAVRSGPNARGWDDPMFTMHYGFQPSVQATAGSLPANASHLQIIDTAMAAAGVPPPDTQAAWESGLNIIITNESAWDPNAINNTDINAQNGIPSQGLAQVIPPTFSAYHVAGTSTNILDPIANVAAAIRYIVSVYGSINNVPGVRSVNSGGGYLPYHDGTDDASMGWHLVGDGGPEMRWFKGGEKVWNASKTKDFMDKLGSSGPSTTGGGGDSSAPIIVENHWHGNPTKEAVQQAEGPMVNKLRQACKAGHGKRPH